MQAPAVGIIPDTNYSIRFDVLTYSTAGESHGKTMIALVDGFPAGLTIDRSKIDKELRRRQGGYGRGKRQQIETDQVEFLSGTWRDQTLGSPIAMQVVNRDYKLERLKELPRPRPGHGDLSGSLKYLTSIRAILERASARETCVRVAAGALAKQLLDLFGIETIGYVVQLGCMELPPTESARQMEMAQRVELRDSTELYTLNPELDAAAQKYIDETRAAGDTLGGIVEVSAIGMPFGLGTHAQWHRKLDGRLAQAVMAVQAIKGVEIGLGFAAAKLPGSQVHDPITFDPTTTARPDLGYHRPTNNAGGLEAGMTNGQPLVIRAAMKPISTLQTPLESIDMTTKQPSRASYERSDVCALSACSVILENVVAFELAAAVVEKFGGDNIDEMKRRYEVFQELARHR